MEYVMSITVRTNVEILSLGKISLHQCNVMRHIWQDLDTTKDIEKR